jgi:gamma-glutamyltranspeptidase/glutathione hydrolase|tara:strand:+ start:144 stop:443 length:300 start_codon:yes stop_codon:yes gene_type:complete
MSAVLQLLSFLADCQMTVHDAIHQPRIDVSGGTDITVDTLLDPDIVEFLSRHYSVITIPQGVYPSMYACPGIAQFDPRTGNSTGAAFVMSPVAAAVGAD